MNLGFELIHPPTNLIPKKFSVGDIFDSGVYLGVRTKYRAWHVSIPSPSSHKPDSCCKVCLRYGQLNHNWVLIVNGEVRAMNTGQMIEEAFTICFKFNDQIFVISIKRRNSVQIRITMTMNGYEIKEIRKVANEIALNESPPVRVSIPSGRLCLVDGKSIVVYRICCETISKERIAVERRYSDFQFLNTMVVGHTEQSLRPNLPLIPPRIINPFADQCSEAFVNNRREHLQAYLRDLLSNRKVTDKYSVPFVIIVQPDVSFSDDLPALSN
jgi:hypothetical protein